MGLVDDVDVGGSEQGEEADDEDYREEDDHDDVEDPIDLVYCGLQLCIVPHPVTALRNVSYPRGDLFGSGKVCNLQLDFVDWDLFVAGDACQFAEGLKGDTNLLTNGKTGVEQTHSFVKDSTVVQCNLFHSIRIVQVNQ